MWPSSCHAAVTCCQLFNWQLDACLHSVIQMFLNTRKKIAMLHSSWKGTSRLTIRTCGWLTTWWADVWAQTETPCWRNVMMVSPPCQTLTYTVQGSLALHGQGLNVHKADGHVCIEDPAVLLSLAMPGSWLIKTRMVGQARSTRRFWWWKQQAFLHRNSDHQAEKAQSVCLGMRQGPKCDIQFKI